MKNKYKPRFRTRKRLRAKIISLLKEGHNAHAIQVLTGVHPETIGKIAQRNGLVICRGKRQILDMPGYGKFRSGEKGRHTLLTESVAQRLIRQGQQLLYKIKTRGNTIRLLYSRKFEMELERWMNRIYYMPETQPTDVEKEQGSLNALYELINSVIAGR